MINVSGFNVRPAEVEQDLHQMPGIQEAALYGISAADIIACCAR